LPGIIRAIERKLDGPFLLRKYKYLIESPCMLR